MNENNYYLYLAARPSCYIESFDYKTATLKLNSISYTIEEKCKMSEETAKEIQLDLENMLGIKTILTTKFE